MLIKENHIAAAGGVTAVLKAAQAVGGRAGQFIEIEVETLEQLTEALDAGAKMVLLDNMPLPMLREAVRINAGMRDSRNLWAASRWKVCANWPKPAWTASPSAR